MDTTELLFSYGTLQNTSVQVETFGRELIGFKDQLLGYQLEMVEIKDTGVVELSGESLTLLRWLLVMIPIKSMAWYLRLLHKN